MRLERGVLCPSRGRKENPHFFYGLRCAREDAGCAPPVATFLGPDRGRKRGPGLVNVRVPLERRRFPWLAPWGWRRSAPLVLGFGVEKGVGGWGGCSH